MTGNENSHGAVMRLFQVKTRPGCGETLIQNFATTSADVVQHEPGNCGYFFGQGIEHDNDVVMFASFWRDIDAIKQRFGDTLQQSFLPEGYEDLIEECSVTHIHVGAGWNVRLNSAQ